MWDTFAAMAVVRRFAVAGLDEAARKTGRRLGLRVGAIDETGQVKGGTRTSGVKRQYLGCAGKVANEINTVHLSYVREGTGHALIGAREWIPAEHLGDPMKSVVMGLPKDLVFRTKGQLAIDILTGVLAGGIRLDFVCGDEVYGSCTELREFCEARDQAYVLRVPSSFRLALPGGAALSCRQAVSAWLDGTRGWEVRSAGAGSKGQRWYAWAWLATASALHHLLIRHHLATGELAFCYCYLPEGQPVSLPRLVPRRRAEMASRRRFRVRQGLLRAGPVPGPPLHRHRPAHRAGHGRPGHLRRHRRPAAPPHRHPGTRPHATRPALARRPRHDPAHRPGNGPAARPPAPAWQRRALAELAPPPPGPCTLVPPAHSPRP